MNKLVRIARLELQITSKCNLSCRGCAHFSPLQDWELPLQEISDDLQLASNFLVPDEVRLNGGEPFLHDKIFEAVESIYDYFSINTQISIATNGTQLFLFKDRIAELYEKYPLFYLIITPHGRGYDRNLVNMRDWLTAEGFKYDYVEKRFADMPLISLSEERDFSVNCPPRHNKVVHKGKLYRCPRHAARMLFLHYGKKDGTPIHDDYYKKLAPFAGLDLSSANLTAVREYLHLYPFAECNLCETYLEYMEQSQAPPAYWAQISNHLSKPL